MPPGPSKGLKWMPSWPPVVPDEVGHQLDLGVSVAIALARGKKIWDKRHALARRQAAREIEQAVGRRLKSLRD
jgi:tmRNA-binding protein